MEHTISGQGRNWFGTGDGKDSEEFKKLVSAGYASVEIPPSWMGDKYIYRLTPEGKKALAKALIGILDKIAENGRKKESEPCRVI